MAQIARLDALLGGKLDESFIRSFEVAHRIVESFEGAGEAMASGIEKSFAGVASAAGEVATELFATLAPVAALALAFATIASAVEDYKKKEEEAKKAHDEFIKAIASSEGKLTTELTTLSALVQVAKDTSESTQARTNAIKELQKEYPGYLSNINLENINSQQVAHSIDLVTEALERKAKAEAYAHLLTKAQEQLIEKQNSTIEDNVSFYDKAIAVITTLGNVSLVGAKLGERGAENQKEAIKSLQEQVDSYSHSLAELTQEQAKNNDFKLLGPKQKEKIDQISEALKKLISDLQTIDRLGKLNNDSIFKIDTEKINALESAIKRLVELGANQNIINKLELQIGQLQLEILPETLRKSFDEFNKYIKEHFKETPIKLPYTPVKIEPEVTNIDEFNKIVQRQILENTGRKFSDKQGVMVPVSLLNDAEVADGIKHIHDELQSVVDVANTLTNAFTQTFEVLLSGGKNAFKALEQALVGLIAKLIATIVEAAILSAILGAITGGSSLVVGGSGFGNILKSLLGSGLQFHAEGGIFTKRTQIGNQVFGEAGPEALIPLDRLQTMLGGMSNQRIEVVGRISGSDIVLIQNRANLRNNRNYGNNFLSFNG